MKANKILVAFVALIAVAVFASAQASAFAEITKVSVDGIVEFPADIKAGEDVFVQVFFTAEENMSDVRVRIELDDGDTEFMQTERMHIIEGHTYRERFTLRMPVDIDPSEEHFLEVEIRAPGREPEAVLVPLTVSRPQDRLNIYSVVAPAEIRAGRVLPIDVVLANFGYEEAERTFVRATIPELGASATAYFGDLSRKDQGDHDKEDDDEERRILLQIPSDAPAGLYTIELEAYNRDSSTTTTKRVVVLGAESDSRIVPSAPTRTFAIGEEETFTLTLVNSGDTIRVYELEIDAPEGLSVEAEESLVVVPAGSSRTVKLNVMSSDEGSYSFGVNVNSDGELVKRENFTARVEGRAVNLNASVLLTVVLAIIFVVLVIVLIVLLTRKPAKKEEFGESYY